MTKCGGETCLVDIVQLSKTALLRSLERAKTIIAISQFLQISINIKFHQISFRAPPPSGSSCYGVDLNRLLWGITATCICILFLTIHEHKSQKTSYSIVHSSSILSLILIFKPTVSLKYIDLISFHTYFVAQGTGTPLALVSEQRQRTHAG